MSFTFEGTIGAKNVSATVSNQHLTLNDGNKVLFEGTPWIICFQRESTRLKTCDAVYITASKVFVHTIQTSAAEPIRDIVHCPIYRVGSDPLPWSKFLRDALKHDWDITDWQHLLEEDTCTEEESSDGEWQPDGEESSDDDDEIDD